MSFVSGAGDGPVAVVAGVVHPLYDPESVRLEWQLRFDLGLVILDGRVSSGSDAILPVGREAEAGETLFLVSWRASDGPRPRQRACPVLSVGIEGLVTLGCEVTGGESGAPVLRKTDRGLELVAIVSSRARLLAQPVAQASNVRLRLPPLVDLADKLRGP